MFTCVYAIQADKLRRLRIKFILLLYIHVGIEIKMRNTIPHYNLMVSIID